jgi:choline kinase
MRAIIIGAGRGSRLMPTTADTPKCFADVGGRRILDYALAAFEENGIRDISFIGGYQIEKVRAAYPTLFFHHNSDWQNNNILASLMYAEAQMNEPFLCCYSDILFTPGVVRSLLSSADDIAVVIDTHWRERYTERSKHPTSDAEKATVKNGAVTRIHRDIGYTEAHGEFIGMTRFTSAGASALREHYHACRRKFDGKPFREAKEFKKAYLIHLYQQMIEAGVCFAHVDTPGGYMEIDTQEDFDLARRNWR